MNILLIGAPGSGKGTESELLSKEYNFTQLSTGDLFRTNISNKTKLGLKAQEYMTKGIYVPDDVTNDMVKDYLQTKNSGLIFDGYPRTLDQAKALDQMLSDLNQKLDYVVHIDVKESVLLQRLSGRLVCEVCKRSFHKINRKPKVENVCDFDGGKLITREDDQEDKIKVRLKVYNEQTSPLINYYREQNKLVEVDGNVKSAIDFHKELVEALKL
ncbi:adenylate kinase [Spiroplasma tabanidicola]|uniref:Adenylate kinase n=1 Tax=Spiroplasma tabanidicola TaxID=324079 RepID=A0A6I6CJT8_9MOLU|nr:adenylate kinase [Spiroplasma tabanidicola]QGS52353.1 adenylate kinase [Spiroplasma tabanidicola]